MSSFTLFVFVAVAAATASAQTPDQLQSVAGYDVCSQSRRRGGRIASAGQPGDTGPTLNDGAHQLFYTNDDQSAGVETWSNNQLYEPNSQVKRAVITVHGMPRGAIGIANNAIGNAPDFDPATSTSPETLVISPRFVEYCDVVFNSTGVNIPFLAMQPIGVEPVDAINNAVGDDVAPSSYYESDIPSILSQRMYINSHNNYLNGSRILYWPSSNNVGTGSVTHGWSAGAYSSAASGQRITSFAVLDQIMNHVLDRTRYPNLERVVVVGHSAGGQTVQRYSLLSVLTDPRIHYVPSAPSTLAYIDARRPCFRTEIDSAGPFVSGDSSNSHCAGTADTNAYADATGNFNVPDASACPDFDDWKYGMATGSTTGTYIEEQGLTTQQIADSYKDKNVVFFIGGNDDCNRVGGDNRVTGGTSGPNVNNNDCRAETSMYVPVDKTCGAMLQGPTRLTRVANFINYLEYYYGKPVHSMKVIPAAGHEDQGSIFYSTPGQKFIYGVEREASDLPYYELSPQAAANFMADNTATTELATPSVATTSSNEDRGHGDYSLGSVLLGVGVGLAAGAGLVYLVMKRSMAKNAPEMGMQSMHYGAVPMEEGPQMGHVTYQR